MTFSNAILEYEDKAIAIPAFAAALDVASSPSGCARQCIVVGLRAQGKLALYPKISAVESRLETLRRMRGWILYRSYAETLSLSLNRSESAQPTIWIRT